MLPAPRRTMGAVNSPRACTGTSAITVNTTGAAQQPAKHHEVHSGPWTVRVWLHSSRCCSCSNKFLLLMRLRWVLCTWWSTYQPQRMLNQLRYDPSASTLLMRRLQTKSWRRWCRWSSVQGPLLWWWCPRTTTHGCSSVWTGKITKKDSYPLHRINESLDFLGSLL